MSEEVLLWLVRGDGRTYLDCTVGYSGHAEKLLEASGSDSRLIGLDRDAEAIAASRERLARFGDRVILIHGHFVDLKQHLAVNGITQVAGPPVVGTFTATGGFFAQPSNIGGYQRQAFDMMTEWGANMGYQLSPHSYDVGPQTPETLAVVQSNAPGR